jgi:type II secretory pathway pseudopilin PulG
VVVIVAILALVAIPKYYANVAKAQRAQVLTNLDAIHRAQLSYYAVYGVYPVTRAWPITVIVDGDTILSVNEPSISSWTYVHTSLGGCGCDPYGAAYAEHQPGSDITICICTNGRLIEY